MSMGIIDFIIISLVVGIFLCYLMVMAVVEESKLDIAFIIIFSILYGISVIMGIDKFIG